MKKYLNVSFLTLLIVIASLFSATSVKAVQVSDLTMSQLVEILITAGLIPADKIAAARTIGSVPSASVASTSVSLPYLQVLSPNGGETLEMDLDLAYEITWGSSSELPVSVALVKSSGGVCSLTYNPVASKSGSNTFRTLLKTARCFNLTTGTSTALTDGSYKVRVSSYYTSSATSTTIKDESNANFTIKPIPVPTIKITYPNGGEQLVRNDTINVKYTLKDQSEGQAITLNLLDSNGNVSSYKSQTGRDGTVELKLKSSLAEGAYKIRLQMTADDKSNIEDSSDNYFWISSKL